MATLLLVVVSLTCGTLIGIVGMCLLIVAKRADARLICENPESSSGVCGGSSGEPS